MLTAQGWGWKEWEAPKPCVISGILPLNASDPCAQVQTSRVSQPETKPAEGTRAHAYTPAPTNMCLYTSAERHRCSCVDM